VAEVRDLVTDALRELGVIAEGETPSAQEIIDGLTQLNDLVDQWAAERLKIHRTTRTTWTIVSGTQTYTVGTTGTVAVARPVYIDGVQYLDTTISPNNEIPLEMMTDDEYRQLAVKAQESTEPTHWYYNPTFPTGTLTLWPKPTGSTLTGVLYAPQAVAEFSGIDDTVSLPPGYRKMIKKRLALELASSYNRPISGDLREQAMQAEAIVRRANLRMNEMTFEAGALGHAGGGSFDIQVGE
jgi:hypothetical protein